MMKLSSSSTPSRLAEREVSLSLRRFAHWIESASTYAARNMGLHVTDLTCIGYLDEQQHPISVKQIVDHVGISSGSGTGLIDRLEKLGYVRRVQNPKDRRGILVQLNAENAEEPLAYFRRLQSAFATALETIDQAELKKFMVFLDIVVAVDPADLMRDERSADPHPR